MTTTKTYTVTSQNCVKQLSELEHGTMFIFPDKPEQLCIVTTTMDGSAEYNFVDLTTGNLYDFKTDKEVNPVSHFKGQITLL